MISPGDFATGLFIFFCVCFGCIGWMMEHAEEGYEDPATGYHSGRPEGK